MTTSPFPPPVPTAPVPPAGASFSRRAFVSFFGVLLPLFTLGFELGTGMSREYFDPVPTLGHVAAVAFVPLAHLLGLLALRTRPGRLIPRVPLRLAAHLNSAALAIALGYAAFYAPITPFAFIAIIFLGLGLLPLAPLFSIFAATALRGGLKRRSAAEAATLPSFWPGFVAGLLALAALEAPAALTARGVHQLAHAREPAAQASALRFLRLAGSEQHLLRGCYERHTDGPRRALLIWAGGEVSTADHQLAYFRVTGRPFNSVPAPRASRGLTLRGRGEPDTEADAREFVWDDSLGDQRVGRRLRALHLVESRFAGQLEGDAAVGYVEWTLVFRNDHAFDQREARALVQLPPGAVVSRLTLWVHGEEREAAFARREQVTQAYRAVVSQRRDPVLVTAQGPDRVLVQCFPIEAKGGLMKVRLGITTPLALSERTRAHLLLPRFIEQNFSTPATFRHHVELSADTALATVGAPLAAVGGTSARPAVSGQLSPEALAEARPVLGLARRGNTDTTWSPAVRDPSRVIVQTLSTPPPPAGPVLLVLAGSAELAPAAEALAAALLAREAPATPFARLFIAGDTVSVSPPGLDAAAQARWLRRHDFVGGQDSTAALAAAVTELSALADGTLVWLHGSQPVTWQKMSPLYNALSAAPQRLIAVPAVAGPNVLLDQLAALAPVTTYARLDSLPSDLARLLRELRHGALRAHREARSLAPSGPASASDHLARLWARDEVERLLATRRSADRAEALRLAVHTRLVTPVSGAVVLETQAQYDDAGLTPGEAKDAPSVPEPAATATLFAAAVLAFAILRRRPRRQRARIHPEFIPAS